MNITHAGLSNKINMTALSLVADQEVVAVSQKTALVLSQGPVGEDYNYKQNREFNRHITDALIDRKSASVSTLRMR